MRIEMKEKVFLSQLEYFLEEFRKENSKKLKKIGNKNCFYEEESDHYDEKLKKAFSQGLLSGELIIIDFVLEEIGKIQSKDCNEIK